MEQKLGPFILNELIGQGGMGKVYKAFDPINHRTVALKVIKDSLLNNPKSKKRFLKEAFIHAKLSHPSIIPIHSIENHQDGLGYSMPFVVGVTLKTILLKLRQNSSYLSLKDRLRHIMKVLEALDYTHSMGYVHRDIKADNIFIGIHDDTYLFDWGLASKIGDYEDTEEENPDDEHLTKPGKIPGTLTHLAPERAYGEKGSIQSDIFSLGVVLYQLLTLKMPFYRKDLEHFKRHAGQEVFELPSKLNQIEDIDEALDLICQRALSNELSKRYKNTKEFKTDLEKVLEGLPLWKDPLLLDITQPFQWMFQDLLPLGSYLALSQKALSWGLLSVPSLELMDNYKLSIKASGAKSSFKVYLNLAKNKQGFNFDHGYVLDIDPQKIVSLYRASALIESKAWPQENQPLHLVIEKIEDHFLISLNEHRLFEISNKVPSICPYIGIVIEDTEFQFSEIALYKASSNKQISCLKLGDHLVFHRCYDLAREEYQKIVTSFEDHREGLEALFRKSYSYILQSKNKKTLKKSLINQGILSFEAFKQTKAAPWEYWGKALCYEALNQKLEMIKCFELGFRKYPRNVFTEELKEELVVMFSKKSINAKKEALMLAFVALRYLDEALFLDKYPNLIESLEEELQTIFVLLKTDDLTRKQKLVFALAFALNQQHYLEELFRKSESLIEKTNALLVLCHLNSKFLKKSFLKESLNFLNHDHTSCRLAKKALVLYGKMKHLDTSISSCYEESFLEGLIDLFDKDQKIQIKKILDYDQKILETLQKPKKEIINSFKKPFFQQSERFIRSNFIISLFEKKHLDYFGYDKAWLEFAIKALF
jgi:serine/threonine-protein kinase